MNDNTMDYRRLSVYGLTAFPVQLEDLARTLNSKMIRVKPNGPLVISKLKTVKTGEFDKQGRSIYQVVSDLIQVVTDREPCEYNEEYHYAVAAYDSEDTLPALYELSKAVEEAGGIPLGPIQVVEYQISISDNGEQRVMTSYFVQLYKVVEK